MRATVPKPIQIFLIQALAYFVITLNMRAVASTSHLWVAATDGTTAFLGFTIIKYVSESRSRWEQIAYVSGSILGPQLALLLPM